MASETGTEADVPLRHIDLKDETYRFRVTLRVTDLAKSIAENGQQVPIVLRRRDGHAKLQLVCGFRRVAALRQLGREIAKAVVRSGVTNDECFRLALLENSERKDFTDTDRANAVWRWRQEGNTIETIAELMGLGDRQIYRLQQLSTLPTAIKEAVEEGLLPCTHALKLVQHFGLDADEAVLASWVERVRHEKLSVTQLARALPPKATKASGPLRLYKKAKDWTAEREVVKILPLRLDPQTVTDEDRASLRADAEFLQAFLK